MTTATSATTKVGISDSMVFSFHEQNRAVFTETQEKVNKYYSQGESIWDQLETFNIEVCSKESELQHGRITEIPTKVDLVTQREDYLTRYWAFNELCGKIGFVAAEIQKAIRSLTPQSRSSECKYADANCKTYVQGLKESFRKFNSLHQKMIATIDKTAKFLRRYCQIVDNGGKPLSRGQCFYNQFTTPVIPKQSRTDDSVVQETEENPILESLKKGGFSDESAAIVMDIAKSLFTDSAILEMSVDHSSRNLSFKRKRSHEIINEMAVLLAN